jgi:hypothetical protein
MWREKRVLLRLRQEQQLEPAGAILDSCKPMKRMAGTTGLEPAGHRAKQSRLLYLAALDRLVRLGKSVGVSVFCSGSSS